MTIRNEIDSELWETIQKNYNADNYTGAILDSIFKLTDTIRNKTGLEGDGASLIGQAFGGDNPRIKLNKMQTDSEKDMQRGIQEILRGIYTAIRNPRSHDTANDSKDAADSIIVFINYLLGLIDNSKLSFDENEFLLRVFDPYYVKTAEYSGLLIQEIPKRQRANIAITTILRRNDGDIHSLESFLTELINSLEEAELSRVYKVISEELKSTTNSEDIRYLIKICPGKYWNMVDESVRLRIENILFADFQKATYDVNTQRCGTCGALVTWISSAHLEHFKQLWRWTNQTIIMLKSDDTNIVAYANTFFWNKICSANKTNITWPLTNYFKEALIANNQEVIKQLENQIKWDDSHPWWKVFEEELKAYPEIKYEEVELPF